MTAARARHDASVALPLAAIRIDGGTQARATLSEETVAEYMEADELPSVDVFHDGAEYWLADGFHRHAAFTRAGRTEILCRVHQGTRRDAILFSVGANDKHGLRRSNADKRRAVTMLLTDEEWSKKSDRWVADRCGVGHQMVAARRSELDDSSSSKPRTGQDGKTRKMPERSPPREPEPSGIRVVPPAEPSPMPAAPVACHPMTTAPEPGRGQFFFPQPTIEGLKRLAAERANHQEFKAHRAAVASVTATMGANLGQRMVDFILDGGEMALMKLGLDWRVDRDSLQRAYRAAAKAAHPDRGGGSPALFRDITEARDLIAKMLG